MRTFEEWMDYQGIDMACLTEDELETWREEFKEACEREKQLKYWKPKVRGGTNERAYAVAIQDGSNLWLAIWIKRNAKGEYFWFILRARLWDPHSSYHRDKYYHHKSHNKAWMKIKRQKPDANFVGNENILVTTLDLGGMRAVKTQCDRTHFDGVLEIPARALCQSVHNVAVDLTEVGGSAIQHQGQIIRQKRFSGHVPEIVITVLKMPPWVKVP